MKKKVGIVTFHKAHNYGALLQAYALKKTLERLNLNVVFIDFDNDSLDKNYRLFPKLSNSSLSYNIKQIIKTLLDFNRKFKRNNSFNEFIKNYLHSFSINKSKLKLDVVFLGSDQIWNPNITGQLEPIFFGQHPNLDVDKVVSYAASMGNGMNKLNINDEFKKLLLGVDSLGVREKALKTILHENFDINCQQNLDPTLLLNKSDWDELADDSETSQNKYILIYEVEKHPHTQAVVNHIKAVSNYDVLVVSAKTSHLVDKSVITSASPRRFVSLFKNASFVVTTSFHGTVFSIINNIPFYTLKFGDGIDNRSAGLLAMLDLSDRHIKDESQIKEHVVDFTNANRLLELERNTSIEYITDNLRK
ncbi:polysaccharide pyruvyl transferase family protein [Vibrio cyclitrophicus]